MAITAYLALSTTEKSLVPSTVHPPLKYLYVLTRSPLSLLWTKKLPQSLPIRETLQTLNHLYCSARRFPVASCLSCTEESRTQHSTPNVASPGPCKGVITAPDLLATPQLLNPRTAMALLTESVNLSSTTPQLHSCRSASSCAGIWSYSHPRYRTLSLSLSNPIRFLSAQFSKLRSL